MVFGFPRGVSHAVFHAYVCATGPREAFPASTDDQFFLSSPVRIRRAESSSADIILPTSTARNIRVHPWFNSHACPGHKDDVIGPKSLSQRLVWCPGVLAVKMCGTMRINLPLSLCLAVLFVANAFFANVQADDVNFGRDVRPILAKHCVTCHGPDPDGRQADLRLDTQVGSRADLGGYQAIMPNAPEKSELISRISSDDPDMRMPPADQHPALSEKEIKTLRDWIAAGGDYEQHWAFVAADRVAIPVDALDTWSRGPIDRFVLRRMKKTGLQPSDEATKESLLRRVYLDLTGVTPSPHELDQFLADESPLAYRRVVERLLASSDYAERFARPWLDLARYSDTNGYEKDRERTIWPYRDWVVNAISADMPFDQFTIEQLAGDMLPDATREQQIATGFHRNTMLNEEGGIDPLEYRYYAMVDRVATTGTVWMGLTTGCAQCHTHKYDPITHTDYYSLMALLNNADEPDVVVPDAAQEAKRITIEKRIRNEVNRLVKELLPSESQFSKNEPDDDPIHKAFMDWIETQKKQARPWTPIHPEAMKSTMPKLSVLDDLSILASGDVTKRDVYNLTLHLQGDGAPATALRLEVLPHESHPAGGPGMAFYEGRRGDFFLSELKITLDGKPIELKDASHSYGKISIGSGKADAANVFDGDGSTGWSTSGREGKANRLVVNFAEAIKGPDKLEVEMLFERHFAAALGRFRISLTDGATPAVAMSLNEELDELFSGGMYHELGQILIGDFHNLRREFVRIAPELKEQRGLIDRLEKQIPKPVRTLGLRQRDGANKRVTQRHHRGEYLQPKETVPPAVPSLFAPIVGEADRLALARWLVSDKNPLVGRVTVNRAWREFFGTGIVRTAGDFGTQSEQPSHPELIDWLDQQWRDGGWSMKRLHRDIVISATYRQTIGPAPKQDLQNRLLSCFPHRRLDAERIRDAMLSAAGLLTRQVGGPSVYPPQPASVTDIAYGGATWPTSKGGDRYRRSLYTFSKRTAPFAAFSTFDGPSGELCVARRDSSTTPLQALTLMNDAMYIEMATGLANETLRELGKDPDSKQIATQIFQRLLTRTPDADELKRIVAFYKSQKQHDDPWMLVARALMNTDEVITTP